MAREAVAQARSRHEAHRSAEAALEAARTAWTQVGRYQQHLDTEQARLRAELSALPSGPPPLPRPDLAAASAEVQAARQAAQAAETDLRALEQRLEALRAQAQRSAEARARQQASQATLGQQRAETQAALSALHPQWVQAQQVLEQAQAGAAEAAGAQASWQRAEAEQQAERSRLATQLAGLRAQIPPLEREKARLEQALNAYARYGEGARNALRLDHPGIVGSVADLLSVPAELETAVTAALGRRLEQVVVSRAEDAQDIIAQLRQLGGGLLFCRWTCCGHAPAVTGPCWQRWASSAIWQTSVLRIPRWSGRAFWPIP
ncbi:hypothetical protein ACFP81_02440 [Deinococcus lacus]|uniref:SMC hinge domain-containing protein n=1 Tax=Deinococcus lacus TaxID=392561 RepID=A0ABW1YBZ8_9DEIO